MSNTQNWFESRKRSVDNLQRIYSFVVSLAVVESLRRMLGNLGVSTVTLAPFDGWMHLLVILVTVVPFYHGASRYLDTAYVTGERTSVKFALLIDFLFLFIESIIFFTLAVLILDSSKFYIVFAVLLLVDIIWVGTTVLTTRTSSNTRGTVSGIGKWAILNVVTIVVVLFLYWSTFSSVTIWRVKFAPSVLLAISATVRSILDYYFVWDFYYPREMLRANPGR